MVGNMAHKYQKFVRCSPKDLGMTTWVSVFLAVIDRTYIASLIKEKTFSSKMISEDTQLIFLDEWKVKKVRKVKLFQTICQQSQKVFTEKSQESVF